MKRLRANLRFAKPEKITTIENGEPKELTVLSFDEKANEDYYKRIGCFSGLIQEQQIEHAGQAKTWHISSAFADHPAFDDLLPEIFDGENMSIYDIPVRIHEDTREYVVLELANQTLIENELWK